jgi:hypothetical protein
MEGREVKAGWQSYARPGLDASKFTEIIGRRINSSLSVPFSPVGFSRESAPQRPLPLEAAQIQFT